MVLPKPDGALRATRSSGPKTVTAICCASAREMAARAKRLCPLPAAGQDVDSLRLELQQTYEDTLVNPYVAAERGYVDAVINPEETRAYIAHALKVSRNKSETRPARKHGIPPL